MSDNRYVAGGMDGWLNVKREPSGAIVALPELIKVNVTSSQDDRDYFVVQEGPEQGNSFSVRAGNLKTGNPGVSARIDWTRFCSSGGLSHGIYLTGFEG